MEFYLEFLISVSTYKNSSYVWQRIRSQPYAQLQTLHAWTDDMDDNEDFDLLLVNLINADKNIHSLQVNSCLSKM